MSNDVLKDCRRTHDLMRRFWLHLGSQLTYAVLQGRLNMPQHNCLVALQFMGEITMGQLARRLGVTMGAATNLVDKLVGAGYVERGHDERDRRIVRVAVTRQGLALLQESVDGFVDYARNVLGQVPSVDRESFLNTFEKIVQIGEATDIKASRKAASETLADESSSA